MIYSVEEKKILSPLGMTQKLEPPDTEQKTVLGDSRKYPYHTTDGLHILTPDLPSEFPKCVIPPCPRISIIVDLTPVRIFHFFVKPFGITCRFANMPNLAYFTENYFKWLYFCSVQLVIEGVIMTPEILEWKFKKN